MKRTLIRFLSLLLLLSFALSFAACGGAGSLATSGTPTVQTTATQTSPETTAEQTVAATEPYEPTAATDLMEGIVPRQTSGEPTVPTDEDAVAMADFAVSLFQAAYRDGQNNLISPLSVLSALAMTQNGAKGETLSQMETVLGMTADEWNAVFYRFLSQLPQGENYKLSLANSIWFTSDPRFTVNRDFLQTNADYFGASVYKAPFDGTTLLDINNWVKNKTDGMIEEILDEIPAEAVMYLINALAFDAEWDVVYTVNQVHDGFFTRADKTTVTVPFLYGEESGYLDDGQATGFVKPYAGGKYAFVALLPNEGVSLSDYVATLDGAKLRRTLIGAKGTAVMAAIPKFQVEDSLELSTVLKAMGMTDAFDSNRADFTGLGTSTAGNIFINRVLHKTFLSLDERGTKAGAATVVEMTDKAVSYGYRVELDRPFVYLLIETESYTPFFIGTMVDPG